MNDHAYTCLPSFDQSFVQICVDELWWRRCKQPSLHCFQHHTSHSQFIFWSCSHICHYLLSLLNTRDTMLLYLLFVSTETLAGRLPLVKYKYSAISLSLQQVDLDHTSKSNGDRPRLTWYVHTMYMQCTSIKLILMSF